MLAKMNWFSEARFGLFVHYGLYSMLGRGEWVRNRERITREEYTRLAAGFQPEHFAPDELCDLAVRAGMTYVVFTTMHHDGFRLYDTRLSDFRSERDLTGEMIAAARKRGLRVGLYHSLNNWHDQPDAVDALESPTARTHFIEATFDRIRELVTRYNPVDILWYDGWWPFNAEGWHAEKMNAMVREIQPNILFNGRNGLPGDFATPEGHLGAPQPWRPWEACMTLNDSWGYHAGDANWKSPGQVIDFLANCSQGRGNLLLNVGPRGDGSLPEPTTNILEDVGKWLMQYRDSIFGTDEFTFDLHRRGDFHGDFNSMGPITKKGKSIFWLLRRWPGQSAVLAGTKELLLSSSWLHSGEPVRFSQVGDTITFHDLPVRPPDPYCPVLQLDFDSEPSLYLTAGMRIPKVTHPSYDPCPSDILQ
ncbi:MAG: alpha-L-fucosidase [Verrucomicrobiota bacterium]